MTILKVIERDICVGCGGCGVATNGSIAIEMNARGYFSANLGQASPDEISSASRVCPFSDDSINEDAIAGEVFDDMHYDQRIGRYIQVWAGRVNDTEELKRSSSGGVTNWVAKELLRIGEVDGVIHVGAAEEGPLFAYRVSTSIAEVNRHRKSTYYSTTLAGVLQSTRGDGRRYAVVGVPCFIKAARLLCRQDQELKAALKYFVGLVCGHMKAAGYAESLAWQQGIPPGELEMVDFRMKDAHKPTTEYRFGALRRGSVKMVETLPRELLGGDWGHASFQLNACNFCDDIYAETADIVLGDAWLPEYEHDWRGTNVIVVRNRLIADLLQRGLENGELVLDPLSVEAAATAQAGNYRHRHQGLAVRLADDVRRGEWVPRKRIAPSCRGVSRRRRKLIRSRRRLSERSFVTFQAALSIDSVDYYLDSMQPYIDRYRRLYLPPIGVRIARRVGRELGRVGCRIGAVGARFASREA